MYSKEDFNKCQFNPLQDGFLLDEHLSLRILIKDIKIDEDVDILLRYTIILYDPNSPAFINERDFRRRREIAMELSGVDASELLKELVERHEHPYLVQLIVQYLKIFGRSKEYAIICAMEYTFWESIQKLFEPISGKATKEELESVQKKSAIKDEIDRDIDRLDLYYRRFFAGDEELEKKVRPGFKPEDVNKRLKEKMGRG